MMAEPPEGTSQLDEQGWASQSSDLIRFKQFTAARRGFDADEVREYLSHVAAWFDEAKQYLGRLERERRELLVQREALMQSQVAPEADPYQQLAARMADVLRAVDQHAQTLRKEVDDDAHHRTEEAAQEAERVRSEAEAGAAKVRQEADRFARDVRSRAEELLGRMTSHRMTIRDELQGLLERTRKIAGQMEGQIHALERGVGGREGEAEADAVSAEGSSGGPEEADAMLSYASDDLLIVLPDLVPTLEDQEEDRS